MKSNTINKQEIEKFSKIASEWWDPEGKFKPLHKFNPIRIKYIKNYIIQNFKLNVSNRPLKKIDILDIGCGGGLLSEPMYRLGASVVGIDASQKNITIAKFHAINIKPFFFNNSELLLIKKFTSSTCSTISIFKITSNFFFIFKVSGEAHI